MVSLFKKFLFLTLVLLFGWLSGRGQSFPLQIQVSVAPPYSAYLQDYPGAGQQVRVFLINTSRSTYQIRLMGQLTGDNGIEIRTSPRYRPPRPVTVPPGQMLLSRQDLEGLFDLSQIEVTGIDKNLLARGLPLPDGTYQLCVRAYNETATNTSAIPFGQALSAEFPLGCSAPIVVRSVEPPILIAPLCDSRITATIPQTVVFTWTPPAGVSPASVEYTLRVVELPQVDADPNVFIDAVVLPKSGVQVANLRTSTFVYGPTMPPLQIGKRYAWRVQAIDLSRKLHFQNDGKSPVCAFTYGEDALLPGDKKPVAYVYKSGSIEATCSCKQAPTQGTSVDNKPALAAGKATVAGFPITFLKTADGVKEVDGVLNGNATIPMPIINKPAFKLRVQLVNVQCNGAGEVISGYVQAVRSNKFPSIFPTASKPALTPPALPVISTANADSVGSQIQKLGEQLQALPGQLVSQAGEVAKSIGMEVPFGIDKTFGPISSNIAITDVIFTPEDAYFNATTFIESPGLSAQFDGIPLAGYHICIKPDGTCGDKILYLAKDMKASSMLTLKGGTALLKGIQANYTQAVFDSAGFKSLHISAGIHPPGLMRQSDNQPMEFLTQFDLPKPDFKNWTAEVQTDDDFYVTGLPDMTMSMKDTNGTIQPAIYDHIDETNPGVMPTNYDPGKDPTWHGLYLPRLTIRMPFLKSLNHGNEVPVSVQNLICDANGFTGAVTAGSAKTPIITLGKGSMDGWYCSTDQLSFSFLQSSFVSGGLNGQVVLPIFQYKTGDDSTKASVWPWTCTYSKTDKSFQFVVAPKNDAYVDLWKAQLSIQKEGVTLKTLANGQPNATAITATYNASGFNAKAVLNMTLSLNTGVIIAPNMKVEGLTFQSSPPAGEDYFSPGQFTAGLNSPQRYIAGDSEDSGLPLELTDVSVGKSTDQVANHYDITLGGMLSLAKISTISAGAKGYVRFRVGKQGNGRPDWGYVSTGLTDASVHGKLGPLTIDGALKLYGFDGPPTGDPTYGKGVSAALTVTMLGASFGGATLEGHFGSKKDGQGWFRYWQVGGFADLGFPGVPIAPAINLRKFGGGAFNRMKMTLDTNQAGEPTGAFSFVPDRNAFGFQAAVGITTADGTALGITGRLTVGFNGGDNDLSLNNVTLDANAQLLIGESPLAKGRGLFNIDFKDNKPTVITDNATLTADYAAGPFHAGGQGQFALHIDLLDANNFYFYLGKPTSNPSDRATMVFSLKAGTKSDSKTLFDLTFGSYFFMGNPQLANLEKLPPDPYGIPAGILQQLNYTGNKGKSVGNTALAFGAGLGFDFDSSFGPFYLDFKAAAGFDLVLQNGITCVGGENANPNPGVNGWYANGQLYAYLDLALGIDVDLWFYSGRLEALKITAAALLEGGMVNPIWLHGSVLLKYRVLGGRIKGSVQAEFWYRKEDRCVAAVQQPNPFADMPIISILLPSSNDPVNTITPLYAEFNYPVKALIEVNDVDAQGNPIDKFRTYRLDFIGNPLQPFKLVAKNGIDPKYAVCANTETGRLEMNQSSDEEFNESNYSATFYRDAALAPNTTYSMTLGVQVYIKESDCVPTGQGINNCGPRSGGWAEYLFAKKDKNGKLGTPESVREIKPVEFTTDACNGTLTKDGPNANVSYSFPFEGQRYFTIDDAKQGFVELRAQTCCLDNLKSDANFDLNVRLVPLNGTFNTDNSLVAKNLTFDNNQRLAYELPLGLQRQKLYRLDVVRIPNDNYVKAQMAELEKQKLAILLAAAKNMGQKTTLNYVGPLSPNPDGGKSTGSSAGSGGVNYASVKPGAGLGNIATDINKTATDLYGKVNTSTLQLANKLEGTVLDAAILGSQNTDKTKVNVTLENQAASIKKKYEQVLYSYYFQTSRYGTLTEKLKSVKMLPGQQVTTDYFTAVAMRGAEGFDTYELDWVTDAGTGKVRPPLVLVRNTDSSHPWLKDYVKPMVGLINDISNATKSNGQRLFTDKGLGNQQYQRPGADYEQLLRSLMLISNIYDAPQSPISKQEITNLTKK